MTEIKFYGRGGQGAVIAAQILAKVFFFMGMYPQCFSVFGGERRGAPVASFLRVDKEKIFLKCEIRRPDHVIYMAPDLVEEKEVEATLKPGGLILINNALTTNDFAPLKRFHLALVDALAVAEEAGLGGYDQYGNTRGIREGGGRRTHGVPGKGHQGDSPGQDRREYRRRTAGLRSDPARILKHIRSEMNGPA